MKVVLVGGSGYVGQNLAVAMLKKSYSVLVMDINRPTEPVDGVVYELCNVLDSDRVNNLLSNFAPDIVIHLASFGMSGVGMIQDRTSRINIEGTNTVLQSCVANNIQRLIYTSSYNVVFGGKEIANGDESFPYFPANRHTDKYSYSKTVAEQTVIQANGRKLPNGKCFLTAAIRPAAIYGEGEQRHLPRIIEHIDGGAFVFRIGRAVVDWVHVENLVQCYLRLVEKLMAVSNSETKPAGQAYFVSDGTPIENFEFLRPLCVARGRRYPLVVLPVNFMVCVSYFMELLYHATARLGYGVSPLLTRAEVYKVGVTHYFSISKAQEELGYRPAITSIDGANRIAKHYEENMPVGENFFEVPDLYWWILIITGLVMLGIVAYDPNCCSETSLMSGVKWLALTIFREQIVVQVVFWLAMAAHVGEAIYASNLAYHHCHNKWILWGIQTFITGFASLRLLLNHCKDAQQLRILNNETRQSTYNALSETDTNTAEE